MIDEQKNISGENTPEEEQNVTAEQTETAEQGETPAVETPAVGETATEAKLSEDATVEDGFSEAAEPISIPAEPVPQGEPFPQAEQVLRAEPEIPTVEEPAEQVSVEADPPVAQQVEPVREVSPGIPQGIPQPSGYPAGYPNGGYSNGYVQQPAPTYGYPEGYPQPQQPGVQPPYPPQYQPPYQPQNQAPYYGYPQAAAPQTPVQPQGQWSGYYSYYGQQSGYPVYGAAPVRPPKKKMSTGLKVFIWIASILAAAAILGFGSYLAYNAVSYSPSGRNPMIEDFSEAPWLPGGDSEGKGGRKDRDEDEIPDFDDGVTPPKIDEADPVPDVDVTPNTEGITIHKQPEGEELSAQEVYQKVVKSTVTVAVTYSQNGRESHSTGTGIIATSDGYIITNSHVVMNSKSSVVEITAYDGQQYEAVVVGVDRTTDLAILKTNDYNFTPAEFGDSAELEIGDSVVAIGNPGGEKFSGSMTGGYISGLDRAVGSYSENGMTYIQTDAAINPGNSGGPLVNMYGQVVGINSSKIVSDGYEGMGFAIPVSKAQSIINELLSGGYVKGRTRLGITGSDVTSSMAMFYNMPQGFVIYEIAEESAFTGTEAQPGDVIIALDGETVTGLTDISNLLLRHAPGDKATVTLYRQDGTELDVTITLLEDKGETQK